MLTPLVNWVENGAAPNGIVARLGRAVPRPRTVPLATVRALQEYRRNE
jgi:hypothetical protein